MTQTQKISGLFLTFLFTPFFAFAQPSAGIPACPSGTTPKNNVCIPHTARTGLSMDSVPEILIKVLKWLLSFLAALAVLMIILSGFFYIISGGDEDGVRKAKTALMWAIGGLAVALISFIIVSVISTGLGAG